MCQALKENIKNAFHFLSQKGKAHTQDRKGGGSILHIHTPQLRESMRGSLTLDPKAGKSPRRKKVQPIRYSQPSMETWDSPAHCQEQMKSLGSIDDPASQPISSSLLQPLENLATPASMTRNFKERKAHWP